MGKAVQTRANGNKTKQRILDAAERLFGEKGFDLVSLRDITDEADVTLALASYHFGTKQKLFEDVVARRAKMLCDKRKARLSELGDEHTVRDLLEAFIAPLFELLESGDSEWKSYTVLLSRLADGDRWLDILERHFDQTAMLFQNRLKELMPRVPSEHLARGFTMVIQLMLVTASSHRRLDRLTDGAAKADDFESAYAMLLDFADAGLSSLDR